jgi:hypothetical protein
MMSHARLKARCSQVRESLGLRLESSTKAAEDGQRVGEGEKGKKSMQRATRESQRHQALEVLDTHRALQELRGRR